jgi:hypothetical protein
MGINKIEAYQNNTKPFWVTVSGLDVTGYTPYFTAKKSISDASALIELIGTVEDSSTLFFCLDSTDTSIAAGEYPYDVTVENDASIYTVTKDILGIFNGVRW